MVAATYCPEFESSEFKPIPRVPVTMEQLRDYFQVAETELYRSKGFRRIVTELRQQGTLTPETQALIKMVGREAIRSTLRQMFRLDPTPLNPVEKLAEPMELSRVAPAADSVAGGAVAPSDFAAAPTSARAEREPLETAYPVPGGPESSDQNAAAYLVSAAYPVLAPISLPSPPSEADIVQVTEQTAAFPGETGDGVESVSFAEEFAAEVEMEFPDSGAGQTLQSKFQAKVEALNPWQWWLNYRTKGEQPTLEEVRQAQMHQIGKTLQEARLAKSLPLEALHQRTHIARHQIRDIEAGEGRWLPEDIYLRSFIRRLGDELGLDGAALAQQLTPLPTVANAAPSWHSLSPAIAHQSNPTSLYLGYAAVVAGSVWGLSWVSQQPTPIAPVYDLLAETDWLPALTAETAREGFAVQPTATVDTAGAVLIQFSPASVPATGTAERAAMEPTS
jgi:cytoskeleton protein RodZ